MYGFAARLDHYLTTPPNDGLDDWAEKVYEQFSEEFYNGLGDFENSDLETNWLIKLGGKDGMTAEKAAKIIERAHRRYVKS